MICYLGKTWCNYWKECKTGLEGCNKAMYPDRLKSAEEWSKTIHPTDLIVAYYTDKPDCFVLEENNNEPDRNK
jgi:hypothetical protein